MYVTMEVSQWKKCGANQESGSIFWTMLLLHRQVEERERECVWERRDKVLIGHLQMPNLHSTTEL